MASQNGSALNEADDNKSAHGSQVSKKQTLLTSLVESKVLHNSIGSYDPFDPKPLDSPKTLKAMELLFIDPEQLKHKDKSFFKGTAVKGQELDKLINKDRRGVKSLIDQVKHKRKEIIKKENFEGENVKKHQAERVAMQHRLKHQSERAAVIMHEIELKNAQEVDEKLEHRYRKAKEGEEEWPNYDKFYNLTYVPLPKEYFQLNAKNNSIKEKLDLSKNKIDLLKHKQLQEMGLMMDYEINIQHIKKRNDDIQKQKLKTLKSAETLKQERFTKNKELLEAHEHRLKLQRNLDLQIKEENKKRLMQMNKREANIKLKKIMEHEYKAKSMKQSENDYEQNRKYMIKELMGDFKELKHGQISTEDINHKYGYLRDEETFERAMKELNYRRHLSILFLN